MGREVKNLRLAAWSIDPVCRPHCVCILWSLLGVLLWCNHYLFICSAGCEQFPDTLSFLLATIVGLIVVYVVHQNPEFMKEMELAMRCR
mmetsp:Transcript_40915/g.68633  ORF Transcript_40915/g.68633 Transcript_40915/m.68633 type:complete len:89 (-) Transcript_40915:305-571(-)